MKEDHRSKPDSWWTRTRRVLLPSCREMTRLTSQAMDAPPGLRVRFGMLLHLALCRICRRYRRQLNWLRTVTGAAPASAANLATIQVQSEVRERLKTQLRKALNDLGPRGDSK